jgi:hypothetical protein
VRKYLVCCPFCGGSKMAFYADATDRDCLLCQECGARWHLYIDGTGFSYSLRWAELEIPSRRGKGAELLGKRLYPEEWRKMALQTSMTPPPPPPPPLPAVTKEKETIIKEVVIIPCTYCGGLMPQTSTFCPHCGAKRKL